MSLKLMCCIWLGVVLCAEPRGGAVSMRESFHAFVWTLYQCVDEAAGPLLAGIKNALP
jgi:hypothetical protein